MCLMDISPIKLADKNGKKKKKFNHDQNPKADFIFNM